MTGEPLGISTILAARRMSLYRDGRVACLVTGSSRIGSDGRPVLTLSLSETTGTRHVEAAEGDTIEFAGATWRVTNVNAPRKQGAKDALTERTGAAGAVATPARIEDLNLYEPMT